MRRSWRERLDKAVRKKMKEIVAGLSLSFTRETEWGPFNRSWSSNGPGRPAAWVGGPVGLIEEIGWHKGPCEISLGAGGAYYVAG